MKYLKSFENRLYVTELPKDVVQNIKDILLELNDLGYKTGENSPLTKKCRNITTLGTFFIINKNGGYFNKKEISDTLERIKDYVKSEGYKSEIEYIKTWYIIIRFCKL